MTMKRNAFDYSHQERDSIHFKHALRTRINGFNNALLQHGTTTTAHKKGVEVEHSSVHQSQLHELL